VFFAGLVAATQGNLGQLVLQVFDNRAQLRGVGFEFRRARVDVGFNGWHWRSEQSGSSREHNGSNNTTQNEIGRSRGRFVCNFSNGAQ
jgi:hypothetical protein